ncbi:GCN5-related N-acetyltransferase (plasmid) [Ruegeria sp. TM1040]|uniref:GNAT family N-acetyltransferase n=1 Tax=Ruegeria sp. (strain TM1040) TaxID=292414 RepID=UPI0000462C41|nr:GNAT family N-acetyltransferase [Ruegeria sp. TM1040]ABF62264.1 GCN5-related N-acetyltransferase [Ruegeria sp. TM1040]
MTLPEAPPTSFEIRPPSGAEAPLARRAATLGARYRWITPKDQAFLVALYRSTREVELDRTPWQETEKQAFITMQFMAQHAHYQAHYPDALWLVIEQYNKAVGRLYLERWEREHRIIDIALLPQTRGQGLGSAILGDLLEEATRAQKSVSIHVEKANPAQTLYRRLGFITKEDKGVYDLMRWDLPADQVNTASY